MPPPPLPYGSSAGGAYPGNPGYPPHGMNPASAHVTQYGEPYVRSNQWGEDRGLIDRAAARAATGSPLDPLMGQSTGGDTYLMGALEGAVIVTGYTDLHLPQVGGLAAGQWRTAVLGDVSHLSADAADLGRLGAAGRAKI